MKKIFFVFIIVAVLGTTFFLFPAVSADTVSASSESSNLTWTYSFEKEVNTMGLTAGQPYNLPLDTSLPYGDNFEYQLTMEYSVGIDGNSAAWRTSYTTKFFGNESGNQYSINLPVSDFPPGSIMLDPDLSVSFGFDMYFSDKSGNLSIDFNLYHSGTGYPATVGNILFTITSQDTVTVYGFYYNYKTSGITSATDFYIPVCYWKVPIGGSIDFSSETHIKQSTEWYTQMMLSSSSSLDAFEVYNSSGKLVGEDSWDVPSDYQTFFIMVYFDGITYPFQNEFLQRKFWRAIVTANYGAGLTSGQNYGYNQGYNDGKNVGYNQGYNAGLAEGTPTSALAGIVSGVSNILQIPLFGDFTLGSFIAIIIGIGLLFLFLKIFAGG